MERKFIREAKVSGPLSFGLRARARSNHLFRNWWQALENGRGKSQKSMWRRGCDRVGRPLYLELRCIPLLSTPVFQAPVHRVAVADRHFRLTGPYRAFGEKKEPNLCASTSGHASPPRIVYFRRCSRFEKLCRRGRVNFQKTALPHASHQRRCAMRKRERVARLYFATKFDV